MWGDRPVIILGHGVRIAGVYPARVLELGVPVLSSWMGADLVDNFHPMYYGSPGIYGQRCANKILYEADAVLAIGCRMSAWMIGHTGLRPEQRLTMVDCDWEEVDRIHGAQWINDGIGHFIENMKAPEPNTEWLVQCEAWAKQYPLIEPIHDDTNGYINSYRAMAYVNGLLRPDECIVVDTGSLMCPVFQAMRFRPPQRVITAGGLGEMGCALPGAIGASFARYKGEVLALLGDGGMMMNGQELATIKYHKLPIKMIVFENDGYSMIKGTFNTVKRPRIGVDRASGISFPDFSKVAASFGISSCTVRTWPTFKNWMKLMLDFPDPFLMHLSIDPEQEFLPRLKPINKDGMITPPRFCDMSPL